jgi:alkyldihydroxyacetonephosphate synthase
MKICISKGGFILGKKVGENWYKNRFSTPYLRDDMMNRGIGVDTLETSTEWSNILNLHSNVKSAIIKGISKGNQQGAVMAHISHTYENGASLYFTFVFPIKKGDEISQWIEIKNSASDAIIKTGGTISHHHGIGIDHLEWLKTEKGEVGMELLKAMKKELDPNGIMNPGKMIYYKRA